MHRMHQNIYIFVYKLTHQKSKDNIMCGFFSQKNWKLLTSWLNGVGIIGYKQIGVAVFQWKISQQEQTLDKL